MDTGTDAAIADHYGNPQLEDVILGALTATGHDVDSLDPEALFAVDELHVGGAQATRNLASAAGIVAGTRVLDIGSGLGGPARLFAHRFGARVVGVDLTPEFVRIATSLTDRTGLSDTVEFVVGSGTDLPFPDDRFDVATLVHVGMNIQDKALLFTEASRVLRPGGIFAVYDMMLAGVGEVTYPMPWAGTDDISFLETPSGYERAFRAAGFTVESTTDRRDAGIEFIARAQQSASGGQPPPLGLHLVIGPDTRTRMGNLLAGMTAGVLAPVEMIGRLA